MKKGIGICLISISALLMVISIAFSNIFLLAISMLSILILSGLVAKKYKELETKELETEEKTRFYEEVIVERWEKIKNNYMKDEKWNTLKDLTVLDKDTQKSIYMSETKIQEQIECIKELSDKMKKCEYKIFALMDEKIFKPN